VSGDDYNKRQQAEGYVIRGLEPCSLIVVASRGKPKAAVVSVEDLKLLEELEDALAAREALAEYERGETITLEELEAELAESGVAVPG